jgi:hypothetical protein
LPVTLYFHSYCINTIAQVIVAAPLYCRHSSAVIVVIGSAVTPVFAASYIVTEDFVMAGGSYSHARRTLSRRRSSITPPRLLLLKG